MFDLHVCPNQGVLYLQEILVLPGCRSQSLAKSGCLIESHVYILPLADDVAISTKAKRSIYCETLPVLQADMDFEHEILQP